MVLPIEPGDRGALPGLLNSRTTTVLLDGMRLLSLGTLETGRVCDVGFVTKRHRAARSDLYATGNAGRGGVATDLSVG
jgi:hypothetical protein